MLRWPRSLVPMRWIGSASPVDRIRKGSKPADLPIEHVTKFDGRVTLKTATALEVRYSRCSSFRPASRSNEAAEFHGPGHGRRRARSAVGLAQETGRTYRIGVLTVSPRGSSTF